jgi:hypothetical protein
MDQGLAALLDAELHDKGNLLTQSKAIRGRQILGATNGPFR